MAELKRCGWVTNTFEEYIKYHDEEWGKPIHDDLIHFEFLILESAQAGLSWSTVLRKRDGYRKAFADFDVAKVAKYDDAKIEELVQNPEIVRNRMKIVAAVNNAKRFIEVQNEFGSFDKYIWGFVNHQVIVNKWTNYKDAPATTSESDALAKDLKKRGFKFLGSTTIYAHMQAVGMINDHTVDCFRYREVMQ